MDESFSFQRWKKSSYFSPRRNESEAPISFNDSNANHVPGTSKMASKLESMIYAMECHDAEKMSQILFDLDEAEEEVDVNQVVPGYSMSILHLSVGFSENNPSLVETLLRYGGDANNRNIPEGLSPLHLAAIYDYEKVMKVLMDFGGDPLLNSGGSHPQTCYDIVRCNVEEEMLEKCFGYLFRQSRNFRKSIAVPPARTSRKKQIIHDSGSDGFYSCESQLLGESDSQSQSANDYESLHNAARRLFPGHEYTNLMTEDESVDCSTSMTSSSDDDGFQKKLTTIEEESGQSQSPPDLDFAEHKTPISTSSPFQPTYTFRGRGIASITAPLYVLTDDSMSITSDTSVSCVNSTPPITPQPTKEELVKLQERMKQLNIPVTPSTFSVLSKYADSESQLTNLLMPKVGACNFSTELQAGIENMLLIHEWGKHKIDFLQNATPTANVSKSFYNYLLLDPKIIKRANFSGDHLKGGVINSREKFEKFLLSIFYIGKAHGKRPLQHLVEAKEKYVEMGKKPLKTGEKIDKILEIWRSGMGVMIVSVFHHSSEREANVSEACMIDAMGLGELSNLKKGSYTGTVASSWSQKIKNQLGSLLLYKSFCTFVVNDPKQFYPHDI